jgi:hypothetical protein
MARGKLIPVVMCVRSGWSGCAFVEAVRLAMLSALSLAHLQLAIVDLLVLAMLMHTCALLIADR